MSASPPSIKPDGALSRKVYRYPRSGKRTVDERWRWARSVAEFVERGRSGGSLERPKLQRMLEYIQDRPVDFVIVHKIDRLARNRADDAAITKTIRGAGAYLVSTTEAISTTPSGRLLPGIMASIGEFKSPLAHANEMAPDLGFYLSGWGSFASEVLEKVLSLTKMGGEAVYGRPLHGRGDVGVDVHRRRDR